MASHEQKSSTHHLSALLPSLLEKVGSLYNSRPDLIVEAWPEIIGPTFAKMTEAVSFVEGVLKVNVNNSTLFSLLNQNDKPRILKNLRKKFPNTDIKTINFRLK